MNGSCHHQMLKGVEHQISRLLAPGIPTHVIAPVKRNILQTFKGQLKGRDPDIRRKVTTLPFVHHVTHDLKKVAARHDASVMSLNSLKGPVSRSKQRTAAANERHAGCGPAILPAVRGKCVDAGVRKTVLLRKVSHRANRS